MICIFLSCICEEPTCKWNEILQHFAEILKFFTVRFFDDKRERERRWRFVHATARLVGGSMTLNLSNSVAMSHVTNRNFQRGETINAGGGPSSFRKRGAFPTHKLSWVIPRSTCTEIREKFSELVLFFANYATQRQSSAMVGMVVSSKSPLVDRARLHNFCAIPWIVYLSPR